MPSTRVKPLPTRHLVAGHSRLCTNVLIVMVVVVIVGETVAFIVEMGLPWWIALSVSLAWTTLSLVIDRQPCGCKDDERPSNAYSIFF